MAEEKNIGRSTGNSLQGNYTPAIMRYETDKLIFNIESGGSRFLWIFHNHYKYWSINLHLFGYEVRFIRGKEYCKNDVTLHNLNIAVKLQKMIMNGEVDESGRYPLDQ